MDRMGHLVPRSKDGGDDIDNRVCSCWVCNRIKRAWDPRNDERLKGRANPSRDELIEAAHEHIKKAKERYERERLNVGEPSSGRHQSYRTERRPMGSRSGTRTHRPRPG